MFFETTNYAQNYYFMIITIIGPTINRSDASLKSSLIQKDVSPRRVIDFESFDQAFGGGLGQRWRHQLQFSSLQSQLWSSSHLFLLVLLCTGWIPYLPICKPKITQDNQWQCYDGQICNSFCGPKGRGPRCSLLHRCRTSTY